MRHLEDIKKKHSRIWNEMQVRLLWLCEQNKLFDSTKNRCPAIMLTDCMLTNSCVPRFNIAKLTQFFNLGVASIAHSELEI